MIELEVDNQPSFPLWRMNTIVQLTYMGVLPCMSAAGVS